MNPIIPGHPVDILNNFVLRTDRAAKKNNSAIREQMFPVPGPGLRVKNLDRKL